MTKLFFDTEFTGLHQKTTLISIGIVSENGKTFYAELLDYDKNQLSDWLKENVISNLYLADNNNYEPYSDNVNVIGTKIEIEQTLSHWIHQFDEVEMWSDCLAYDWVLFNNIWGDAFSIPKNIYYIPFDISTLFKIKNINPDINREEFCNNQIKVNDSHNWGIKKHNALWDAYVIKQCYEKLIAT